MEIGLLFSCHMNSINDPFLTVSRALMNYLETGRESWEILAFQILKVEILPKKKNFVPHFYGHISNSQLI